MALDEGGQGKMLLETLLSAALEAGFGLIADAGFGDAIRDLKDRLTNATERRRRDALERAIARAREAVGDDPIKPLLEHRPFFEEIVKTLLDPRSGFDVEAVGEVWQDRPPQHDRALRQFFSHLETGLFADDTWGPILDRFQALRHRKEVSQALQARNLDIPAQKVVHEVSLRLNGSGGMATTGGVVAGAGGVAVAGDVGQIVLQQFIMQNGAQAGSANLRQRYLSRLRLHCCDLPLDALGGDVDPQKRVTLDQVCIDLNTATSVPANILEQIQQGRITQWAEVENALRATPDGPLREAHLHNQEAGERDDARRPLPPLDALRLSPYVTFLGDPGAGKSIFVRIVIARVIDGTPPPGVSTELLPVLIVLRDLVQRLVSIDLDALPGDRHAVALAIAVRDQIIADLTGLEAEGFGADLREALNAHRCLLVFADLDEVPPEWRGLVQRAVVTVINHYQPHRVIVTCRTRSYLGDATLPGFNAFTLTPFDAKQIASFARAWYNAQRELGRVDAVQARQKGTNLAAVALQPALRALAANPMLLTAMALIHQQDTRDPDERVCLNDRAMTLLLHRWERQRVLNDMLVGLLGDARRTQRLVELATILAQRPGASLPEACGDRALLKAAYRFVDNAAIDPQAILESHVLATSDRLAHPAHQGLLVHTTRALTPERLPLGLLAQQVWARDPATIGPRTTRKRRPIVAKESQKWLNRVEAVSAAHACCPQTRFVCSGDREADVYDLCLQERPSGVELLVRAAWNRRVDHPERYLWTKVAAQPMVATLTVRGPRRGPQPARQATVAVR